MNESHFSKELTKERTNERKRIYTRLTKQPLRQFVAEPYLTPFHHINLVMRELHANPITLDEASSVVEDIICRYNPLMSAPDSQANKRVTKNSQNRDGRRTESILSASQISMSQYEGQAKRIQPRNALLADALQLLCESRDLIFERHNIRKKSEFTSLNIIPGEKVLLYVSKSELYFVSLFALSARARQNLEPLFRRENRKSSMSERPLMQVTCCFPHPAQWRCVAVEKVFALSTQQCVLVSISRNPEAHLGTRRHIGMDSMLNGDRQKENRDEIGEKRSRDSSYTEEPERLVATENLMRRTRTVQEENTSDISSGRSALEPDSFMVEGSILLNGRHFVYPSTPYNQQTMFSREDSVLDDPFFRLPRRFTVPLRSRSWCNSIFLSCAGRLRHKTKIMEDARKATEEEIDGEEMFLL